MILCFFPLKCHVLVNSERYFLKTGDSNALAFPHCKFSEGLIRSPPVICAHAEATSRQASFLSAELEAPSRPPTRPVDRPASPRRRYMRISGDELLARVTRETDATAQADAFHLLLRQIFEEEVPTAGMERNVRSQHFPSQKGRQVNNAVTAVQKKIFLCGR